jgi:hypothetical protein
MGELEEWPQDYEAGCENGGTINVSTMFTPEDQFSTLEHVYEECAEDGWIFSGRINYEDLSRCEGSGFTFTISGELEVEGYARCAIDAIETCGVLAGDSCGFAL